MDEYMHAAHGSIDIAIRRLLLSLPVNLHQMEFYMTHLKHSCKYHRLYMLMSFIAT